MFFLIYCNVDLKYMHLATNIGHVFKIIISMYGKKEMK